MNLSARRNGLLGGALPGKIWIYQNGVVSPIIGNFSDNGYQYGSPFSQSKRETDLFITSTSPYNIRGGRTWTGNRTIPPVLIGRTLRCTGHLGSNQYDNRIAFVRMYLSGEVATVSSEEDVSTSGAFLQSTYVEAAVDFNHPLAENTNFAFDLSLPITQPGFLSLMLYKGYSGLVYASFESIWIE